MRKMLTFIVYLLVDDAEPMSLRGTIRAVSDGERTFTSGQQLLEILMCAGQEGFAASKFSAEKEAEKK